MSYLVQADITDKIPLPFLNEALDDDGDGNADPGLLDQIIASCSNDVDAYLSGLFTTPFPDPCPAQIKSAAIIFVCEALYERRLTPDQRNPFASRANRWRDRLQLIGDRKLPLDAGTEGIPVAAAQGGSQQPVPGRIPVPTNPVNDATDPPNYP